MKRFSSIIYNKVLKLLFSPWLTHEISCLWFIGSLAYFYKWEAGIDGFWGTIFVFTDIKSHNKSTLSWRLQAQGILWIIGFFSECFHYILAEQKRSFLFIDGFGHMGVKWLLSKFQGSVEWTFLILQRILNYDDKCISNVEYLLCCQLKMKK